MGAARLLDGLGQYPTVLTIVAGVGAAVCGSGIQESWGERISVAWALGVAAFVALPAISAKRNRLQQSRRAAQDCIQKALAALAAAYGHPTRQVRTNIMLAANGKRRVDPKTAFNMDNDPDRDLEIDATAGVSGEAFVQRATIFGDVGLVLQAGGPSWGLRQAERAKVRRELNSILSVPIYDPDDTEGEPLGTLQVDSDLTITEMGFDVPEQRAIAERFADVIALLLKAGH